MPWMTLLLSGLVAALFAVAGPVPADWVYDREAIAAGQAWRLFSGHLVHSDLEHLAWNLAGLAILGPIVERHLGRKLLLVALLLGSLLVDLALWTGMPWLKHYCGLSGVLNTLLLGALAALWRRSAPLVLLIGAGSLAKILWEMLAGQALLTQTAWASVPVAHLAGWLAGLLMLLAMRPVQARRERPRRTLPAERARRKSSTPCNRSVRLAQLSTSRYRDDKVPCRLLTRQ
jgi:rhomboid family GlyGly-CTERM serine protease